MKKSRLRAFARTRAKKSVQLRNTYMPNAFGSIGMVFQLIATLGLGRKMGPNSLLNRI